MRTPRLSALASLGLSLVIAIGPGLPARAQRGPAEITVDDLALQWALGRFATPVICHLEGKPVRGLRRILISPGSRRFRPAVNRILFVDMDVSEATRCVTELAGPTPNLSGSIQIRLNSNRPADTAQRDFREMLRRKGGFEFDIVAGGLKVQPVTQPPTPARGVDFTGGRAALREIEPGTDLARLLAPFPSPRKLHLEISARDGTTLAFPLYLTDLH